MPCLPCQAGGMLIRAMIRLFGIGCAVALCTAPRAQEGGIELFSGEFLFARGTRLSLSEIYSRKSGLASGTSSINDPLGTRREDWRTVLGLDHGLAEDWTVTALVPYVYREARIGPVTAQSSGLGDVAVLTKYRLFHDEWQAGGTGVALVGGIETPTGRTDVTDNGMLLDPRLQPGFGAWNPFMGVAWTYGTGRARFDTGVFYKLNTEGDQDFEAGDFFSARIRAGYRIWHSKYPGPTLGVGTGIQWRHESRSEQFDVALANSGSDLLAVELRTVFHPAPQWDMSLGAEVPVYRDYNGVQLEDQVRVQLSVAIRF